MPEFRRASDYLADFDAAKAYIESRPDDLEKFMASMQRWETCYQGKCLRTIFNGGNMLVHELVPCTLHATPCWGELFFQQLEGEPLDPVMFLTFEQFAAFMLRRYW